MVVRGRALTPAGERHNSGAVGILARLTHAKGTSCPRCGSTHCTCGYGLWVYLKHAGPHVSVDPAQTVAQSGGEQLQELFDAMRGGVLRVHSFLCCLPDLGASLVGEGIDVAQHVCGALGE